MGESAVQASSIKWLRSEGHYAVNIHGGAMQEAGVPDVLVCLRSRRAFSPNNVMPSSCFGAIEFKRPGEVPSVLQLYHLEQIRKAGGVTLVAYKLADVQDWVDEVLSWQ